MIFSSLFFLWVFLPVVLLGSRILPGRWANLFLTAASLFFYAWGEPVYVLVMLASIAVNYICGLGVDRAKSPEKKKAVLTAGIIVNLFFLFCFKYLGLFTQTLNSVISAATRLAPVFPVPQIALPIGISFFTFQGMSYVIDVYRGEVQAQRRPLYVALYISFFPQLIAGPIVRYKDICEQIENRHATAEQFVQGVRRFIYGFAKKVLIANVMAQSVDALYGVNISTEMDGVMAWCAGVMYAFQIYYDFSGYSDMAIGLGKMFGFEFLENFNYPYLSCSIREFWRRWHISLSTWFREYVYIPLGGNRKGVRRTYLNLFIVFSLTGVWHGAGSGFILWGLYHGFFSVAERLGLGRILDKHPLLSRIYLFFVVIFGWVFFRVENLTDALFAIKRMIMPWMYQADRAIQAFVTPHAAIMGVCAFFGMGVIQRLLKKTDLDQKLRFSVLETIYLLLILLLSIAALASNTYNPFIYFKF